MADYDNRLVRGGAAASDISIDAGLRAYMLRVYNYMLVGLGLTGAVAWATANTSLSQIFYHQVMTANGVQLQPNILGWIAFFAPLALTFFLSFRVEKMSFGAVQGVYWAIAALMGVQLAMIFFIYTGTSIATTFFVTAAMFGGMSLYGYTTGRDLTSMGSFLVMGVWGLLIAMLVTSFFPSTNSPAMSFVINALGVVIFTGLTAYDTQRIKNLYYSVGGNEAAVVGKVAVMGALSLYLDFYNMFLFLLRLFGDRR